MFGRLSGQLCLFVGLLSIGAFADDVDPKKIRAQIESEWNGTIVPRESAAGMYSVYDGVFNDLNKAFQSSVASGFVGVNELHIVNSPVVNACVVSDVVTGTKRMRNQVFLSTSLIRVMSEDLITEGKTLTSAQLKTIVSRIAGVLAHEYSHATDKVDPSQIYRAESSSQSRELKADLDAIALLVKAGYPADGLYGALQRLEITNSFKAQPDSSFLPMLSSHPKDELRKSAQRIATTMRRYQVGTEHPDKPAAVPSTFIRELKLLNSESERGWKFQPPATLKDTVSRLLKYTARSRLSARERLDYNRLILDMDRKLAALGNTPPSEEDTQLIRDFFESLPGLQDRAYQTFIDGRGDWDQYKDIPGGHQLGTKDHYELMENIPFYRSPSHLEWAKNSSIFGAAMPGTTWDRGFWVLPPDQVRKTIGPMATERYKDVHEGRVAMAGPMYPSLGKSPAMAIAYDGWLHDDILPMLKPTEYMDMLESQSSHVLPVPINRNEKNDVLSRKYPEEWMAWFRKPATAADRQLVKTRYQELWNQRAQWALREVMASVQLDWEKIGAELGIPKEDIRPQIRQALKTYLKGSEYAAFLKELAGAPTGIRARYLKSYGGYRGNDWDDGTLAHAFLGDANPLIQADAELQKTARASTFPKYVSVSKAGYASYYDEGFRKALVGQPLTYDSVMKAHQSAVDNFQQTVDWSQVEGEGPFSASDKFDEQYSREEFMLKELSRRNLPRDQKFEVLKGYFTAPYVDGGYRFAWLDRENITLNRSLAADLTAGGAFPDYRSLLTSYSSELTSRIGGERQMESYSQDIHNYQRAIEAFADRIIPEIRAKLSDSRLPEGVRRQYLMAWSDLLNPKFPKVGVDVARGSKALADIKAELVKGALGIPWSPRERDTFFYNLTEWGPTAATDQFVREKYPEVLAPEAFSAKTHDWLDKTLRGVEGTTAEEQLRVVVNRFYSNDMRLKLAQRMVEPEIKSLTRRAGSITPEQLAPVMDRFKAYVPQGSKLRDDYLESIGWRLDLRDNVLKAFIEGEKSTNWKKENPLLVSLGSGLVNRLVQLDEKSKNEFINYIVHSDTMSMPDSVFREIRDSFVDEAFKIKNTDTGLADVMRKATEGADQARQPIERQLREASATEKIPLIDIIVGEGDANFLKSEDLIKSLARTHLGYEAESNAEKMLIAFLRVIPSHERSVTLAYLLSQKGQGESSVKALFQVFQTVGIKFGQMASVWKVFGDDIAKETADLKDKADPLTKAEIEDVMKELLTPEELAKVDHLEKVLGSASLKTAALVKLKDGRSVVFMVQRPNAAGQIESNIELVGKFVAEMKKMQVDVPTGLFDQLLKAMKVQLMDEAKMSQEAVAMGESKAVFERTNRRLKGDLNGYSFRTAQLLPEFKVRDRLLVSEYLPGVSWKKLPPDQKPAAGRAIVLAAFDQFANEGWFDPDRHVGNSVIDGQQVGALDFGQRVKLGNTGPLKWDDRAATAMFFKGLTAGNADDVAEGLTLMSAKSPESKAALAAALKAVFAELGPQASIRERVTKVVSEAAHRGWDLKPVFTTGVLKGFMLLEGEGYVSPEEFDRIATHYFKKILVSKAPLVVGEEVEDLLHARHIASPSAPKPAATAAAPSAAEAIEAHVSVKPSAAAACRGAWEELLKLLKQR